MYLLTLAACLATFWLLHTAMVRIERMQPPKETQRPKADVAVKTAKRPGR